MLGQFDLEVENDLCYHTIFSKMESIMTTSKSVTLSPLGKNSAYISHYDASLLFPIPRKIKRDELNLSDSSLPFVGFDVWNAYELSWLNKQGKPQVALAEFTFDCLSKNIIESKSFKLYLNSFNNTRLESLDELQDLLLKDLKEAVEGQVNLKIMSLGSLTGRKLDGPSGICIDDQDITFDKYTVDASYLTSTKENEITEVLYSNLLKSNCLVTGQPDWGTLEIHYTGPEINRENLLRYIVSFRNHNEFHEQCVERIFIDLFQFCKPSNLTVKAFYTRRGGLDINPIRSTSHVHFDGIRTVRQ
jgi:7-cyano-7-deazaguanine reductase